MGQRVVTAFVDDLTETMRQEIGEKTRDKGQKANDKTQGTIDNG